MLVTTMVNFGWSPMKYWGELLRPLTASVESGQSSPSFSTGGGCTAAVGVTDSGVCPGGATTGVLPSVWPAGGGGWGAARAFAPGWPCADAGLSALAGLAPGLLATNAMTVAAAIPGTTAVTPHASPPPPP